MLTLFLPVGSYPVSNNLLGSSNSSISNLKNENEESERVKMVHSDICNVEMTNELNRIRYDNQTAKHGM